MELSPYYVVISLRWRHNDHAGVSNQQPHGCLLNRLFRRKSKKTSKLRVIGFCAGNSPGTDEFPAQMASYAENVSIWWRHHIFLWFLENSVEFCKADGFMLFRKLIALWRWRLEFYFHTGILYYFAILSKCNSSDIQKQKCWIHTYYSILVTKRQIYVYNCVYTKLDANIFTRENKKLNMFDRIASKQ